jgi:transposase
VLQHAEEVSGNVAAICRYHGIGRTVFCRCRKRYEDEGLDGLQDRSSAPSTARTTPRPRSSRRTCNLRQYYHFGPLKISIHLKRYYDVEMSHLGVWRVLKRLDMNRLPAPSGTNRTTDVGNATRSSAQATSCRSTSSSSNP